MDLELAQDLGREVSDLWTEDGDRIASRAARAADHERIARVRRRAQERAQVDRHRTDGDLAEPGPRRGQRTAVAEVGAGGGDGHRDGLRVDRPPAHVGERLVERGRRLRVVLRAEVAPDGVALRGAVALHERAIEERAVRLVAAADGEDGLHERRGRHDIGRPPGLRHLLQGRVLGRQEVGVRERRLDVGIDPVDVGLAVGHDLLALRVGGIEGGRELGREPVDLLLQLDLVVAGDARDRAVEGERAVRWAEEGGGLRAPDVSQHVHEEQAVLGSGIARGELGVRARVAEDVRRAKGLVAHDDGARTRHLDALDLVGRHAEARILVEAAEVGGLEVRRHLLEVGVRRDLILLVRRHAPSGLLLRELGRVHQAVRPGWQDVVRLAERAVEKRGPGGTLHGDTGRARGRRARRDERRREEHRQQVADRW